MGAILSTEVVVALIAAGGIILAGGVGMVTAYLTARYQAKTVTKAAETEFLADRDKLLWEQAGKFWDQRAANLTSQVDLERTARESAIANLTAQLALVKQDNAMLRQENIECAETLKRFEDRLKRAGQQLVETVEAATEAVEAATESTEASVVTEAAVAKVKAATEDATED